MKYGMIKLQFCLAAEYRELLFDYQSNMLLFVQIHLMWCYSASEDRSSTKTCVEILLTPQIIFVSAYIYYSFPDLNAYGPVPLKHFFCVQGKGGVGEYSCH